MSAKPPKGDYGLTRERVNLVVLTVVTALVFYLCYRLALPFIPALTLALMLAVIGHPLHEWIRRHTQRRSLVAAIAVLLIAITIAAPAIFVTREVAQTISQTLDDTKSGEIRERWRSAVERNPRFARVVEWIEREVNVRKQAELASEGLLENARKLVSQSFYVATGWLITLYLLFYFFRDQEKILGALRGLVPLSPQETSKVFRLVRDTIYGITYGTLLVASVQGALGGLIFWWFGLPAPILWGTVMALLAVLPVMGAALVWAPAAIFLALEGDWHKALILFAWGTIVIGLIDNLLYPILIKDRMRLHTVPVSIAVLGGLVVFGAAGIVLGPVVLALAVALIEIWRRRMADYAVASRVETDTAK